MKPIALATSIALLASIASTYAGPLPTPAPDLARRGYDNNLLVREVASDLLRRHGPSWENVRKDEKEGGQKKKDGKGKGKGKEKGKKKEEKVKGGKVKHHGKGKKKDNDGDD